MKAGKKWKIINVFLTKKNARFFFMSNFQNYIRNFEFQYDFIAKNSPIFHFNRISLFYYWPEQLAYIPPF